MKTNKRLLILSLVLTIMGVTLIGCDNNVDSKQSVEQEKVLNQQNNEIGLPNIKEFSEKKMAKEILELRDDSKLVTYAYMQNEMSGKFIFLGQCIGFALPYSTQYTNPQKTAGANGAVISQADPNGLFSPSSANATWIQYINPDTGKREIIYCEPNVVVAQSKLPKRLIEPWSLPDNY